MNKKTKLAIAAGIAAVVGLGAAGAAEADCGMMGHRWGMGMHGDGPGPGFGMAMIFKHMEDRYDANHDGKISQDEIDKNRADWLQRFDSDKDGALSLKEFEALWLEARRQEMIREFQFFDKDGDAKVTLDEYKAPLAHIVAEHDRNGDGVLSKDDRPRGAMRWHGGGRQDQGPGDDDGGPDNQPQ